MRIACIHLPAFPLQVAAHNHPIAEGAVVAIVSPAPVPAVIAVSRAARAAGIGIGMHASAVREHAPGCEVVTVDPELARSVARGLAEALGAIATEVDDGGRPQGAHHAVFARVPTGVRGAAFGARAIEVLGRMGLVGRVGIADDRFTAAVAAAGAHDRDAVVSVPRGGSAAFLAPLPLALLELDPEVQHVLEVLGVRTLGAFAALPPPSVARPWDADFQSLARGDGGAAMRPIAPVGPIDERAPVGAGVGVGAAIGAIAARIGARLAGRDRAAAALELELEGHAPIRIIPDAPVSAAAELADLLGAAVGAAAVHPTWVRARVTGFAHDGEETAAVVTPMVAQGSVPVAAPPGEAVPMFRLEPTGQELGGAMHRRTRRGKQRPRLTTPAQSQLFAGRTR